MINYLNVNNPDFFDNDEKLYDSEAQNSISSGRYKIFNILKDSKINHGEIIIHCENN